MVTEISGQGNVWLGKCLSREVWLGKCPVEELSVWRNVYQGSVHQGSVSRGSVLGEVSVGKISSRGNVHI